MRLEYDQPLNEPLVLHRSRWARVTKRSVDLIFGSILLMILSPLMLLIALFIFFTFTGPVIYRHTRVGLDGKGFVCLKFRTMVVGSQEVLDWYLENHPEARSEWEIKLKLRRDPRVTKWGRFLRTWSLDELPQLWNVVRGDISMVGPRPLLPGEVAIYGAAFQTYCRVKPGITGIWQVSGRNCLAFADRARLDSWYINHWSLAMDLKLLLRTLTTVLGRKGAY